MDFHMAAVERHWPGCFARGSDCSEDVLPNSPLAPAREAIIDRLVRTIPRRAVLPAASALLHMHDPAQDAPIIVALGTALVGWQMRLDLRPLCVIKPKQIRAHRLGLHSVDQALESTHG